MPRSVLLLKFTDKGIAQIMDSPKRADAFRELAGRLNVTIETQLWMNGGYDGLVVMTAPDANALSALALQLGSQGFVRTEVCHAYDEDEFKKTLGLL